MTWVYFAIALLLTGAILYLLIKVFAAIAVMFEYFHIKIYKDLKIIWLVFSSIAIVSLVVYTLRPSFPLWIIRIGLFSIACAMVQSLFKDGEMIRQVANKFKDKTTLSFES